MRCSSVLVAHAYAKVGWHKPRGVKEGILHLDCPLHMRVRGPGPPTVADAEFLTAEERFLEDLASKARALSAQTSAWVLVQEKSVVQTY